VAGNGALAVSLRIERRRDRARADAFEVDVEFEVPPGITILFGPSGSGKSTILQCIAGIEVPDRGRIALGEDVWFDSEKRLDRPVHRRHVAYLFQSLALFPHMTALDNVEYGIDRAIKRPDRRERARGLLARVGVSHLAERKPRTFSGGEAQRVALARALAVEPKLILLDEPFSALDRDLRAQLSREVRSLVDELAIPTLQVTHHHGEARAMGDRMIVLADGRITARGGVAELLDSSANPA
jgi:molybdate transport system ATP-binding protein